MAAAEEPGVETMVRQVAAGEARQGATTPEAGQRAPAPAAAGHLGAGRVAPVGAAVTRRAANGQAVSITPLQGEAHPARHADHGARQFLVEGREAVPRARPGPGGGGGGLLRQAVALGYLARVATPLVVEARHRAPVAAWLPTPTASGVAAARIRAVAPGGEGEAGPTVREGFPRPCIAKTPSAGAAGSSPARAGARRLWGPPAKVGVSEVALSGPSLLARAPPPMQAVVAAPAPLVRDGLSVTVRPLSRPVVAVLRAVAPQEQVPGAPATPVLVLRGAPPGPAFPRGPPGGAG